MYKKLAFAIFINTVIMFLLTYVMIDEIGHFYFNINRVYMAILMAAPMVIVMLIVMRSMFENRNLNYALHVAAVGLFIIVSFLIRTQTPIREREFLRAMIPHHSGAILMCEQATLDDPEVITLCEEIVKTQIEEINQMEGLLERH